MEAGQHAYAVQDLASRDDAVVVAGNYRDVSVQHLSAPLPHSDVSQLTHPADRFSVVLYLQVTAY